jgi:hypothetical protein
MAPRKPSDSELIADLLADAKVAALYGQRVGILPDAELQKAIHDVEALPKRSWADEPVLRMQTELNKTMRNLSPITLAELKGPEAPFVRSTGLTVQSVAFVFFSVLLVVCAAWFTLSYNQGNALIQSIQRLDETKARTRIYELAREIVTDSVNPGITSAQAEGDESIKVNAAILANYFSKTDEMESLDREAQVISQSASLFIKQNVVVIGLWEQGITGVLSAFSPAPAPDPNTPAANPVTPPCADPTPPSTNAGAPAVIPAGSTVAEAILLAITHTRDQSVQLTCTDKLNFHIFDFPPLTQYLVQLQEVVNVYGLWLLPALYGALGASMFHLRRLLNPILPNPSPLRLIYRFTVGAFAGIIIAWFWTPDTTTASDAHHVGFSIFAVAFLTGYGIDIFFALLDRLLNALTSGIGQIGASKPSGGGSASGG